MYETRMKDLSVLCYASSLVCLEKVFTTYHNLYKELLLTRALST